MFNKLDKIDWKNPNLKILDPAAGFGTFLRESYIRLKEFHSEDHILNNMLYACEINGFKTLFLEKKMGLRNIYRGDFLTMQLPEGWPKEFDIVVSNPPYSKKLDLKFLDKAFDISKEEIVFVTPSSHYMQKKGTNNLFNQIIEKTTKNLNSLTFFNGNPIFDINLFVPCVVTHIEKNNNKSKFFLENIISNQKIEIEKNKILEIYYFGYDNRVSSIKSKTENMGSTFKDISTVLGFKGDQSHRKFLSSPNNFFVEFTHVRGHIERVKDKMVKDDYFTFFKKDTSVKYGTNPSYNIWFEFSTEKKAVNFIKYCKTDFARFCLFLGKFSQSIAQNELACVPALDFTQEWSDEKLYSHFNITKEEQEFIKKIIPPFYD
jgi:hypothetical protein